MKPAEGRFPLRLLTENPAEVLERLRQGWIESFEDAADQVTDLHLLCALQSGLLQECAAAFPDPRQDPEIPALVLLAASVAGAFQGEYALCQAGCALHSPVLLAELGLNAQWLTPGEGLSRRGTEQEALFHPDTLRKLLQRIAQADQAEGRRPGESLLCWWNETVGPAFRRAAGGGSGLWILDATTLLVRLKNPRYEQSEVTRNEKGDLVRGYKLALLSSLIDEGRLITRIGWAGARAADPTVALPLVKEPGALSPGEKLLQDRGLIDGETISCLKRDLGVDTVFPLKREMLSFRLALAKTEPHPRRWERHPSRPAQEIQGVTGIDGPWEECRVPLNGCVVREWQKEQEAYQYWVFASTDLTRSARGIIKEYEARSECEEDHRQLKGKDWEMDEFTSTSLAEILYHVLVVLFAYNLCQLYGLTQRGERFAGKTKRARQRALRRERETKVVIIAPPYYAVLPQWQMAEVLLEIEGAARERLRQVVARQRERAACRG
jgi:hypothetical protein